jgi:uncharacterized protein YkwD
MELALNRTLTLSGSIALLRRMLACTALLGAVPAPAPAQDRDGLADLINAYRAAPGACDGRPAIPAAPLTPHAALSAVRVDTGTFLDQALERAGYRAARAEAIFVSAAPDARSAMAAIARKHCRTLLSTQFSAVGAGRTGDSWLIVLAQPALASPVSRLPDPGNAGPPILEAVNAARSTARSCGGQAFAAAPALAWNSALGDAALAHSADMASQGYFDHRGKDGRVVNDRALQAGYRWRRIGENIAAGQESPDEAVAGWLSSPGHCANIMDARFTDMGAAYAINRAHDTPRVYWTQVFGTPR